MGERRVDRDIRILADHGLSDKFVGVRRIISPSNSLVVSLLRIIPGGNQLIEILWGLKCWIVCLGYDRSIPIVTVGHGHGFLFAFLQFIFKPIIRPRTHLMFDLLLNRRARGLASVYDKIKFHIFNSVVELAVVWGQTDVGTFANEFDIPEEKLMFHPHHITLERYEADIRDDGFIFAGGNGGRDYRTLIEAVKLIDYPVFVATTLQNIPALAKEYDNITVKPVSHEEFRERMAACTIFIEAHDPDFFRTAGHQTFLNAMWMGKPVVMADERSAVGYFDEGVDGLIVPAGDSSAFRRAIQSLLDDSDMAAAIGARAKEKLHRPIYRTLNCMQSIYNVALDLADKAYGLDQGKRKIEMY